VQRTFEEINEKIKKGKAVVLTAEEAVQLVAEEGVKKATQKIDVVTTATFGPMCSSGAVLNFGHSDPPIRMGKIYLNDVEGYGGLAAVDTYIGATQPSETKGIEYGGAHVIEDLLSGKSIKLHAKSYGTDCYPRKEAFAELKLEDLNQAMLFNPRNVYQNYPVATNSTDKTLYTYMGILLPEFANATYSTSGELSPLLKDPDMRTIGIGTRIFIGGAQGYIAYEGTQTVFNRQTLENGEEWRAGATLMVLGDMKKMSPRYVRASVFEGYGTSLYVGIGVPIPILDEDVMEKAAVPNSRLFTKVFDYGVQNRSRPMLKLVSYEELRSGHIELNGIKVKTASLSSLKMAREIAGLLKQSIESNEFLLQAPIEHFDLTRKLNPLNVKDNNK
jgi:uncharacterized protein (DUF39 family)